MWTISLLKQNGNANFKKNYWYCVVATIVLGVCIGGSSGGSSYTNASRMGTEGVDSFSSFEPAYLFALLGVGLLAFIIGLFLKAVIFNPIQVGCQRFFIMNRVEPRAELSHITYGFKSNWKNLVKTMFLKDIYLFLWTLLFIIPGIIKSYSYRLVPYILAENPNMDANEAITLSRDMMNGQKMKAFLYDLSFIGWVLLSFFTCLILYVFYVGPYKVCSDAELYTAIKETYRPQPVMQ